MISIAAPVWRKDTYRNVALPWIAGQVARYDAELIEVQGDSIFEAHERGRLRAKHDIIMYVHDDVRRIEPDDFAPQVVEAFEERPNLGLIGPVGRGSIPKRVPWWTNPGPFAGHYLNRKDGKPVCRCAVKGKMELRHPDFRHWNRWQNVAMVDGFFLIEHRDRMNVPWDTETFPGEWHGYDTDRCMQAHERGLDVMVSPWLFMHDNGGHAGYKGTDPGEKRGKDETGCEFHSEGDRIWLRDFKKVNQMLARKWGLETHRNFS